MIKIICVGKIKENYIIDGVMEYKKRLSKYTKLEIIELPDYNYDVSKTINEEGKNILSKINDKDFVVTLEINGTSLDSVSFSKFTSSLTFPSLVS